LRRGSRRRRRQGAEAPGEAPTAAGGANDTAAGWTTLMAGIAITAFLFYYNQTGLTFERYYLINIALLLWVPFLLLLVLLRRPVADFGMATGDLKRGALTALVLFVLFLPVIFVVSGKPEFQTYYIAQMRKSGALGWGSSAGGGGALSVGGFVFHQAVLGFYMFAWEWYFRGFLLFGLKRLMPAVWASLLQASFFALLHYNKPLVEVVSSFFGALLLAAVALRFRSFLPCFFVHFAISASFDAAVLYHYLGGAGR